MFYRAANGYNFGMTMTGLKVEVTAVEAEQDEAEIAAAVACVFAILRSRGVDQSDSDAARESNWGIASRIEAVGQSEVKEVLARPSDNRSAWWSARSSLFTFLTALSLSFLSTGNALAADDEMFNSSSPVETSPISAPPFAPQPGSAPSTSAQASPNIREYGDFPPVAVLPAPSYAKPSQAIQQPMPSYPVSQLMPSRSGQLVRVLLSRASKTPDLAMIDGANIINLANMEPVYQVAAGSRFQIRCENKRLVFAGADPYALAQVPTSGSIRQVVAMVPRVLPQDSSFRPNASVLNKFALSFDVPDAPPLPAKGDANGQNSQPGQTSQSGQVSQIPAPKGGVKPIGYLVLPKTKDGLLSYNGRVYRGAIWLKPIKAAAETSFQAINLVDLEDYLLSVVPSEMPTSWHIEAVKAQSIAARSYAVANYWKNEKDNYDVKDTTDDQVYLGVESETATGNQACDETAGVVLKHNQKVISAFFHSTSGGATEVGENVWGKEIPYVQSVVDYDDNSPHFAWQRKFAVSQAEKAFGLKTGSLLSIQPFWKVASNRVKQAAVVSLDNTTIVTGERLRHLFKLPSSIFNVSFEDNNYIFAGRGFGHGLGMSQYGAKTLAESGYNAAQILSYYYRDVSVEYLNRAPGI